MPLFIHDPSPIPGRRVMISMAVKENSEAQRADRCAQPGPPGRGLEAGFACFQSPQSDAFFHHLMLYNFFLKWNQQDIMIFFYVANKINKTTNESVSVS